MSSQEQGIAQSQVAAAKAQAKGADTLAKYQKENIAYLNDRILLALGALVFLGLLVVWATASSALILYGSLVLAVLLGILWAVARVYRKQGIDAERSRQVEATNSQNR